MLSQRFVNDGVAKLALNEVQLQVRDKVTAKIRDGLYRLESVPCCVCGGTDFETLAEKDRYGLYLSVVICRECGLIQSNPRMTQESYASFYNKEYRLLYDSHTPGEWLFEYGLVKGRRIYRYLAKKQLLNGTPPFVVEVGCAAGGILHYFKGQGCQVKGVDLDGPAAAWGREKHGLDISRGTIHDLSFDRSPDLIIYADVLEHLCDPERELNRVAEILPKNGIVYIEMPGSKGLLWSWRDFMGILQNAHTYHFSLTSLSNLMGNHGFSLVAGNEFIYAAFKNTGQKQTFVSDYKSSMSYLRRWEKLHFLSRLPPGTLRSIPFTLFINALKRLRLYNLARSSYHVIRRKQY